MSQMFASILRGERMYQAIAMVADWLKTAVSAEDRVQARHFLNVLMSTAPHGAGIDADTRFILDKFTPTKMVFLVSYHHMTNGMYTGWTEHNVTAYANLIDGVRVTVGGSDRSGQKDDLYCDHLVWLHMPCSDVPNATWDRLMGTESSYRVSDAVCTAGDFAHILAPYTGV